MPVYKLTTPRFNEHSIMVKCCCHDTEHSAELTYFDNDWELTFSFHLCPHGGLLERLRKAVRYVLGRRCRYGHWDTILVGADAAAEIIDFLRGYVDSRK